MSEAEEEHREVENLFKREEAAELARKMRHKQGHRAVDALENTRSDRLPAYN